MGMDNEMDIGEAMDEFYSRRVEKELEEQRGLRKKFLDRPTIFPCFRRRMRPNRWSMIQQNQTQAVRLNLLLLSQQTNPRSTMALPVKLVTTIRPAKTYPAHPCPTRPIQTQIRLPPLECLRSIG